MNDNFGEPKNLHGIAEPCIESRSKGPKCNRIEWIKSIPLHTFMARNRIIKNS